MKLMLMLGTRVMVALIFVVGLMSPGVALFRMPGTPDPNTATSSYIEIRFRGLMVFDKVVQTTSGMSGTESIWLHSGAEHHKLTIQIKGPEYDDFLDWGHSYGLDADLKLEVKDRNDSSIPAPTWRTEPRPSMQRPYGIAALHPVGDGLGELVMLTDSFGPKLTMNAGEFYCGDPTRIVFRSDDSTKPVQPDIPRLVVARIELSAGQTALLTGRGLKTIRMNEGESWEIVVRNNPDAGRVCEDYHFIYYYDGFRLVKNGRVSQVPDRKKYRAESEDDRPCLNPSVLDRRAIPTRPCIPTSN